MKKVVSLIILMAFISGLRPVVAQEVDHESIRQLTNTWVESTNAENIEGLLNIISDDATIIGPGVPPLRGKESIEAAYHNYYAAFDLNYSVTINEIKVFDNTAYVWLVVKGIRAPKNGGDAEQAAFNNLWLLKKKSTGWKFWRVMYAAAAPVE